MAAAETSIWTLLLPVIVGGVLGLAGGVVGPWLLEARKEKSERRKARAQKLEELVSSLYEHKHWLGRIEKYRIFDGLEPEAMSPFAKVEAIAAVHFPQFLEKLSVLEDATAAYEMWMFDAAKTRAPGKPADTSGVKEAYGPYSQALRAVLKDIRQYAKAEFQ